MTWKSEVNDFHRILKAKLGQLEKTDVEGPEIAEDGKAYVVSTTEGKVCYLTKSHMVDYVHENAPRILDVKYGPRPAGQNMLEATAKSTLERIHRHTRLPNPEPTERNFDQTPHRPANNDPTKTGRGKMSVRRQGLKNKRNAAKFKKHGAKAVVADDVIKSLDDPTQAVLLAEQLDDPVSDYKQIVESCPRAAELIKNVWASRLIERYAGMCAPTMENELALFDKVAVLFEELKGWGDGVAWIERVQLPGCIVYKACYDGAPSEVFAERRGMDDRHLILSNDRANIIQIAYGD